jgi:hypothetical protein
MAGIIHFSSGKTLEITEAEFSNMSPKLNMKGIKTQRTVSGHLIPLNSMTMEYIEHVPEKADSEINNEPVMKEHDFMPDIKKAAEKIEEEMKQQVSEPEKPKTAEEIMAEMTEKSNCKHEPEKLELYRQHTAKGIRYFPRCTFCGKRERYVSESKIVDGKYEGTVNEKWTSEDIANAKDWID